MTIHNKPAFVISMIAAAVMLYFVGDRVWFLRHAERTTGSVIALQASNERCGSRRSRYDCTRFHANVAFFVRDDEHRLFVDAGSARGHNRPLTGAKYRVASTVNVVFSAANPAHAYRDTWWDVWARPAIAFLAHLVMLVVSFIEPRRSPNRDDGVTTLFGGSSSAVTRS